MTDKPWVLSLPVEFRPADPVARDRVEAAIVELLDVFADVIDATA